MEKILISSCLIGDKTRYDGKSNYNPLVKELLKKYELVPFCCEVEGGLPTPRLPSEIQKDGTVKRSDGKDVTHNFEKGAEKAAVICSYLGIRYAILKESSPSCGVHKIYDGTFTGRKIEGQGIMTKLLISKGIKCYSDEEIQDFLDKDKKVEEPIEESNENKEE